MKTIGRILIILVVFSALSGLMVLAVNASGSNTPNFDGAPAQFRPQGDGDGIRLEGDQFNPEGGQTRPERGERGDTGGPRWMFGLVKNVGVMALLVTLVVLPKSIAKNKRKQAAINSTNGEA
jgi:hypothetical protein